MEFVPVEKIEQKEKEKIIVNGVVIGDMWVNSYNTFQCHLTYRVHHTNLYVGGCGDTREEAIQDALKGAKRDIDSAVINIAHIQQLIKEDSK